MQLFPGEVVLALFVRFLNFSFGVLQFGEFDWFIDVHIDFLLPDWLLHGVHFGLVHCPGKGHVRFNRYGRSRLLPLHVIPQKVCIHRTISEWQTLTRAYRLKIVGQRLNWRTRAASVVSPLNFVLEAWLENGLYSNVNSVEFL